MTTTERLAQTLKLAIDTLNSCQPLYPLTFEALSQSRATVRAALATWEAEKAKPMASVLFRQDEDGIEPVMLYGPGAEPDPDSFKDRFVLRDVWLYPREAEKASEQQAERLTLPNGPTKIPRGTLIFHDHGLYRWPNSANGTFDQDVDLEFNAVLSGGMIELTAPEFGGKPYRNGSILVKTKHWLESVKLSSQEGTQP